MKGMLWLVGGGGTPKFRALKHTFSRRLLPTALLLNLVLTKAFGAELHYQRIKSFGISNQGAEPAAGLLQGSDGRLYGTTLYGGASDGGVVYRIDADGRNYEMLRDFSGALVQGTAPRTALTEDSGGRLYGTTSRGGTADGGTLFRLNRDGSGFLVLHDFGTNGEGAACRVLEGPDGLLYGMTAGVLYRVATSGADYVVLHRFQGAGDAYSAETELLQGSDGKLYGTRGRLFSVQPDGSKFTVLHMFQNWMVDGLAPTTGVVQAEDGKLYGTTQGGGAFGFGTLFSVSTNGENFQVVYAFDGQVPRGLPLLREGAFFGTAWYGGLGVAGGVYKLGQSGVPFDLLWRFSEPESESSGLWPQGGLVQGTNGQLYGNTSLGGSGGHGVLFSLGLSGTNFVARHHFGDGPQDGNTPASLISASDGFLYGTARRGSNSSENIAFRMRQDGTDYQIIAVPSPEAPYLLVGQLAEGTNGALYSAAHEVGSSTTKLVRFNKDGSDLVVLADLVEAQSYELPSLISSPDGVLFGTSFTEGTNHAGAVYKVNQDGTGYAVLHHFGEDAADGSFPAYLLVGKSGAIYGTTSGGMTGNGTLYRVGHDGTGYQILHQFDSTPGDGAGPQGLWEGQDGLIYGVTSGGGTNGGGTLFSLHRDGMDYRRVHAFEAERGELTGPVGALVGGNDRLYGSTAEAVFALHPDGTGYEIVHRFNAEQKDGWQANGVLILTREGDLCGTTQLGGDLGLGTVFRLFAGDVRLRLSAPVRESGGLEFFVSGAAAGLSCRVESSASTEAGAMWNSTLVTNAPIDGRFRVFDSEVSGTTARFYRALSP
jgi:uncharacterized repeat protein (TIGR03803 family)